MVPRDTMAVAKKKARLPPGLWTCVLVLACIIIMLAEWYYGTQWSYVDLGFFQR